MSNPRESGRLYTPCPTISSGFGTLFVEESLCCGRFYARCCCLREPRCHPALIVYTDGACLGNGSSSAVAGIGIAFGENDTSPGDGNFCQFSIPVNDALDPEGKRTSQRTELLAAIEGLKMLCRYGGIVQDHHSRSWKSRKKSPLVVVTTDSQYVVEGMTKWLPKWKINGFRKADGRTPANLDLFQVLDEETQEQERRHGCEIKFWHIYREDNTIADGLAKRGARAARVACVQL